MQNQSPKVYAQNFLWNEPNEKANLIKSNEERANGQQKYMTPQIRNKIQTQIPRRIRKTRAYHVQQMEKKGEIYLENDKILLQFKQKTSISEFFECK